MNYVTPQTYLLDLNVEGCVMLTQSYYDQKHGTEHIEWDDAVEL